MISLFDATVPSVAYIDTFVERRDPFARNTGGVVESPLGTGSGIVWDKLGHVVTNFHVIRNTQAAQVTLTDSRGNKAVYKASLRGYDIDKDIAVLKLDLDKDQLRKRCNSKRKT